VYFSNFFSLQGPQGNIAGAVRDEQNGTYFAQATAYIAGLYDVNITVNGVPSMGSPLKLFVEPGKDRTNN
jgi:hypothetical protein